MPRNGPDNEALAAVVRAWVATWYPGRVARRLRIDLDDGERVQLPVRPAAVDDARHEGNGEPVVPTAYQQAILDALEGRALRTDALAAALGGDRRRLFRAGGLSELREQGLVSHHARLGFYREDVPPGEVGH